MKNITIDESANSLRLLTAEAKNGKQTPKQFYTLWATAKQVLTRADQETFFRVLKSYKSVSGWCGKAAYEKYGPVKPKADCTVPAPSDKPAKPSKPKAAKGAASKSAKSSERKSAKSAKSAKADSKAVAKDAPASASDVFPVPAGYVMLMADGSAATHYMVRHGVSIPLRLA